MSRLQASIAIICFSLSSCGFTQEKGNAEEMLIKAAELKKLSSAVESTVRYKNPPPDLNGESLLRLATAHNPILLEAFKDYVVKVYSHDKHSVILVCNSAGTHALLEDAGCSGQMDGHHWRTEPLPPCEFTIKIEAVCVAD